MVKNQINIHFILMKILNMVMKGLEEAYNKLQDNCNTQKVKKYGKEYTCKSSGQMLTVNNNSKFHFEPDYRDETGMEQECGGNCNYAVQCEAPDGRTGIKQSWTHGTDEVGSELHTRNPLR